MVTGRKRTKTPYKSEGVNKSRKKHFSNGLTDSPLPSSLEPLETVASEEEDGEAGADSELEQDDGQTHDGAADNDEHAVSDGIENTSSFHLHLDHVLTNEEISKLNEGTRKFQSQMPAIDMPKSKWVGTGNGVLNEVSSDHSYGIKKKLYNHWLDICKDFGSDSTKLSKQRFFFSLFNTYQDILHCNKKPFYREGTKEDASVMDAYIMHALNHVYHTRDLVTKNDAKLVKHQEANEEEILRGGSFLDQGFTRPKVMFLLPLRSIALRVVKRLIQLTPLINKANVEHIGRFNEEFGSADAEDEEENNTRSKPEKTTKPSDFQVLFGGNNDDNFMMGIKFTKRSIKLYGNFYSSDIIVASPVALACKIAEAEEEKGKGKDVDYLSSIEILIIDHADVIAMQNWVHLDTVVKQLNQTPSKHHGTDVMRIRQWYLDGYAHFYRQTILLGAFLNPDMNAVFNRLCANYRGKVKLVSEYKGVLSKVLLPVRQVYERFVATSIGDADEARLAYFTKKVFPKIKDSIEGGIMLFISSYFEFVRIRNFLKSENASFCLLGEYTKQSDISRARVWFFEGKRKIMLYTERAHFHHRYKIKGINNLIIYSLPERKEFYPEMLNMLEGSSNMTCNVLFSQFDRLRLEGVVGTAAAKRMLSSDKDIFAFC